MAGNASCGIQAAHPICHAGVRPSLDANAENDAKAGGLSLGETLFASTRWRPGGVVANEAIGALRVCKINC